MAIIYGNADDNLLSGTPFADRIFGYGGDDTLIGGGGADTLAGGSGDDLLAGGGGADVMNGGSGDDTVSYRGFTARISLSLATGVVDFHDQNLASERLASVEGAIGGRGDDTLTGGASRDVLHGGGGDDFLDGGIGADALFGDAGDDYLSGGYGSDTLDGGAGSDVLLGDTQDSDQFGYFDAETNNIAIALHKPDTVSYAAETAAVTLNLGEPLYTLVYLPGDVAGRATVAGSDDADTLYGFQNAVGGAGADALTGNSENNLLTGGRGNDTLRGGSGDDTLAGGAGTDRLLGGAGIDTVDYSENTGPVRVTLALRTASFPGTAWPPETFQSIENVATGSGNDVLIGDRRDNTLDGGLGSDRISGGAGSDTVSYASHAQAVSVDLGRGIGTVASTGARDILDSIENATGGAGNDALRAAAAGSVLDGGLGDDTLTGGAGNDTFHLTAGSDVIHGGAGSDTVVLDFGYDAYPQLTWSAEQDYLDENQWLVTYGGDTTADLAVNLAAGSVVSLRGPTAQGALDGVENVTTGAGNDLVTGSRGANVISVGHGANVVDAGAGNDLVYGSNIQTEWPAWADNPDRAEFIDERDANEVLRGGLGSDTLVGGMSMFGQGGNDRLVAALVADETRLVGGTGADSFVFSDSSQVVGYHEWYVQAQHVRIPDFSHDEGDRIVIVHADPDTPDPTFVGTVTDKADIDVGEWGFYGNRIIVPRDYDVFEDTETPAGLEISIVGGNITAADVFFV